MLYEALFTKLYVQTRKIGGYLSPALHGVSTQLYVLGFEGSLFQL